MRRALQMVTMSYSSYSYKGKARDSQAVRMRMREIAASRVHYGCERVFVVLRWNTGVEHRGQSRVYFPLAHRHLSIAS